MTKYRFWIVRFRSDEEAKSWGFDNEKGIEVRAQKRSSAIAYVSRNLIEFWNYSFIDAVRKFKANVVIGKEDIINDII